jgi:hypothetical protein
MPYATRPGSCRKYLYRSVRGPDGRSRRQYVGSSGNSAIRLRYAHDVNCRNDLADRHHQITEEVRLYRDAEPLFRHATNAVRRLFYVAMWLSDFGGTQAQRIPMTPTDHLRIADPNQEFGEDTREQLERLRRRANSGDTQACLELREMLARHPEIYQQVGNLVACAQDTVLRLLAPTDAATRESVKLVVDEQANAIASEGHGTALEQLLTDHLMLNHLQVLATRFGLNGSLAPQGLRGDAKFWAARHDRVQKQFHQASQMIVELRRVLSGQKQVDESQESCRERCE